MDRRAGVESAGDDDAVYQRRVDRAPDFIHEVVKCQTFGSGEGETLRPASPDEARSDGADRAPNQGNQHEHRDEADDRPAGPQAPEQQCQLGNKDGDDADEIEVSLDDDQQELHPSSSSSSSVPTPSFSSPLRVSSSTSRSGFNASARR